MLKLIYLLTLLGNYDIAATPTQPTTSKPAPTPRSSPACSNPVKAVRRCGRRP